jgi:hypothetical protein
MNRAQSDSEFRPITHHNSIPPCHSRIWMHMAAIMARVFSPALPCAHHSVRQAVRPPARQPPSVHSVACPSALPSVHPSARPCVLPSARPSRCAYPSVRPPVGPSACPAVRPAVRPTISPSSMPSNDGVRTSVCISKPAGAYLPVSESRYRQIQPALSCQYLRQILTR